MSDLLHSDYTKLNQSIGQSGFSTLNDLSIRFGFGTSVKTNRWIKDFYFAILGPNSVAKRGNEKIKTSMGNLFQFDFGYDLLQSNVVSIYPYAGLSFRLSNLNYQRPMQTNPSYTNISDIVVGNNETFGSSARLGYQAGLGLDFRVSGAGTDSKRSTIIFVKGGVSRPIGTDKYKIGSVKYNPGITQGDWVIGAGVKFAMKR